MLLHIWKQIQYRLVYSEISLNLDRIVYYRCVNYNSKGHLMTKRILEDALKQDFSSSPLLGGWWKEVFSSLFQWNKRKTEGRKKVSTWHNNIVKIMICTIKLIMGNLTKSNQTECKNFLLEILPCNLDSKWEKKGWTKKIQVVGEIACDVMSRSLIWDSLLFDLVP